MKSIIYFLLLHTLLLLLSCKSKDDHASKNFLTSYQPLLKNTKFIGHKGAGDPPLYGYQNHSGNSIESIHYAIKNSSGSEIDLQISADSTLWLFHDPEILLCDSNFKNVALLNDRQIRASSPCNYADALITLDEFIEKTAAENFKDKTLSLDLKVLRNTAAINLFGSENKLANQVSSSISALQKLSGFKILVEVPWESYIPYFQENNLFEIYLLTTKDEVFQKTQADGYSADIKSFNEGNFKRKNNKKLQLWVCNSLDQLLKAASLKADYVQSDNISLLVFLKKSINEKLISKDVKLNKNSSDWNTNTYIHLKDFHLDSLQSSLVLQHQFKKAKGLSSKSLLVFSCKDKNGSHIMWVGQKLKSKKTSYIKYINAKKLIKRGGEVLKVFVWNQDNSRIKLQKPSLKKWYFNDL